MKKSLHNIFFIFTLCLSILSAIISYRVIAAECYPNGGVGCISQAMDQAKQGRVSSEPVTIVNGDAAIAGVARAFLPLAKMDGSISMEEIQQTFPGRMAFAISYMYQKPPANLALWVNDTGQTLGFIPKSAYAQGTGFIGLSSLLNVWKVFRNIAYILIAVALVIIGFMIMFRRQIDPHTVMTIQNSLPRVIISLILITFSYAIAAFMIELMYVALIVVITLVTSGFGGDVQQFSKIYIQGGALDLFGRVMAPMSQTEGAGGLLTTVAAGGAGAALFSLGILSLPAAILIGVIGFFGQGLVGLLGGSGGAAFINPILWLVFAVALFFFFFRVFFLLIGAYIQILLAVIIGPLHILMDVLPGSNGFTSWLAGLVGNLATFVVVATVLMIDGAILSNIGGSQPLWAPPLIGGLDTNILKMIIGVGGVMIIPSIVNGIKDALQAGAALPIGEGAASALGSPVGSIMEGLQTVASLEHITGKQLPLPWRKGHGGGGGAKGEDHNK